MCLRQDIVALITAICDGREIGEKAIMCGKAVKWWDGEIKEKILIRRLL